MWKGQDKQTYVKSNADAVMDIYSSGARRKESSGQFHGRCALELNLEKCTGFLQGHRNGMDCAEYGEKRSWGRLEDIEHASIFKRTINNSVLLWHRSRGRRSKGWGCRNGSNKQKKIWVYTVDQKWKDIFISGVCMEIEWSAILKVNRRLLSQSRL